VGFNAMQPGKVKRGDLLFLVSAVVVIGVTFAAVFLFVHW
jgi:hypothetical protein